MPKKSLVLVISSFIIFPALTVWAATNGVNLLEPGFMGGVKTAPDIVTYAQYVFKTLLWFAVALSVLMITYGGVKYILSESLTAKGEARGHITNAIYGLVIALVSWLILYTINPNILNWKLFSLTSSPTPAEKIISPVSDLT